MIQVFQTNFPPQNTPIVNSSGAMTTPGMAFLRALFDRTGQGPGIVSQVAVNPTPGDITTDWVLGTGAFTLPSLTGGQAVVFQDNGAGSTISAPAGATIDGGPSYSLGAGKMQIFWFFSASQIFSTQLG